jgi:hypothetical protein
MKRAFGLIGILLVLGACVAASWLAIRPPLVPFLAPGATELQVANMSIWEQHISYRAPAGPTHGTGPRYTQSKSSSGHCERRYDRISLG